LKTAYNILLGLLHTLGLLYLYGLNSARFIFFYDWHTSDDVWLIIITVLVFLLHYSLLFFGYKKNLLTNKVIVFLRYGEYVLIVLQAVLLGVMCLPGLFFAIIESTPIADVLSLNAVLPLLIIHTITVLFRKISDKAVSRSHAT